MTGVEMITAERQRQIDVEGWTPEHDAEHNDGALVLAAVSYARYGRRLDQYGPPIFPDRPDPDWPWEWPWWKPSDDPVRNLVKAGALIAAEIDRLTAGRPS